jgi:hypothetical protein
VFLLDVSASCHSIFRLLNGWSTRARAKHLDPRQSSATGLAFKGIRAEPGVSSPPPLLALRTVARHSAVLSTSRPCCAAELGRSSCRRDHAFAELRRLKALGSVPPASNLTSFSGNVLTIPGGVRV